MHVMPLVDSDLKSICIKKSRFCIINLSQTRYISTLVLTVASTKILNFCICIFYRDSVFTYARHTRLSWLVGLIGYVWSVDNCG